MPVVAAASKYLQQKWQEENFRNHRYRVKYAVSTLDVQEPRQFPHLKLSISKHALEEELQAKYNRENQQLLDKIKIIVKGKGTIGTWNTWVKKDLHADATLKRQREIEQANEQMLKRIKAAKAVIRRVDQEKDFLKHRHYQEIVEMCIKDYPTHEKRQQIEVKPKDAQETPSKRSVVEEVDNKGTAEQSEDTSEGQEVVSSEDTRAPQASAAIEGNLGSSTHRSDESKAAPPPLQNKRKKKRTRPAKKVTKVSPTGILKLPSIETNQKISSQRQRYSEIDPAKE